MNEFEQTLDFFLQRSISNAIVRSWDDCQKFISNSNNKDWVYLIKFSETIYAWGTASKDGKRLRKTNLFHEKLSGKYDRKVDYLMLKIKYGQPTVQIFEFNMNAREVEQERRVSFYGRTASGACLRGFTAGNREMIAKEIFDLFKTTDHYLQLDVTYKNLFDEFVSDFWLAKLKHPINPARTFYYGDCLEPNFLSRTLSRPDLIPIIEKTLKVKF